MGKRDARVDAYIAKKAAFARPILERLRALVHEGCPGVTETIKWGMPAFEYRGPLANMAAFKQHATFGFWKGKLIVGGKPESAMGQFGRITTLADLPAKRQILAWVKQAAKLNEQGVKLERTVRARPRIATPPALLAALRKVPKALAHYRAFAPSHQREYNEWIASAKQDETRARRIATAVEWLTLGRHHNWRYEARMKAGRAAKPARRPAARTARAKPRSTSRA